MCRAKAISILAQPALGMWHLWAWKEWVLRACPEVRGCSPGGSDPIWAVFAPNPGALLALVPLLFAHPPAVDSLLII